MGVTASTWKPLDCYSMLAAPDHLGHRRRKAWVTVASNNGPVLVCALGRICDKMGMYRNSLMQSNREAA